jgi:GntR family transcriptional repressor for pyruvate dehydrogenase complex
MRKMNLPKITRTRLVDKVVEEIYKKISEGELKAGDKFPGEIELSMQMGVARTTIREAMNQLIGLGLISRGEYGMYVAKEASPSVQARLTPLLLESWEIRKLYEARMIIESEMAVLAAMRAGEKHIKALKDLNRRMMDECSNETSYWENDVAFHDLVAKIADNEILYHVRSTICDLFNKYEKIIVELDVIKSSTYQWHADLIDAIERGDKNGAKKAIYSALEASEKALLEIRITERLSGKENGR